MADFVFSIPDYYEFSYLQATSTGWQASVEDEGAIGVGAGDTPQDAINAAILDAKERGPANCLPVGHYHSYSHVAAEAASLLSSLGLRSAPKQILRRV